MLRNLEIEEQFKKYMISRRPKIMEKDAALEQVVFPLSAKPF